MGNGNGSLRRKAAAANRRVVVLVVPPVDEFDLVCPIQVFGAANHFAGKPVYSVEVVTNGKDVKVQGEGGVLSFVAETSYKALGANFDSLLLVCGLGTRNARDATLFAWLRRISSGGPRLGSVCVGSFLLAEAGLLNGRRATSHWRFSRTSPPISQGEGRIRTRVGQMETSTPRRESPRESTWRLRGWRRIAEPPLRRK